MSDAAINLSPKEQEALRLAAEWSGKPIKPIQVGGGKVVYVLGATMPTIIGAPMEISDIELEPGEQVNEFLVGDSARWLVESGSFGGNLTHIFVKPLDAGLQTSLVVTTNKRVLAVVVGAIALMGMVLMLSMTSGKKKGKEVAPPQVLAEEKTLGAQDRRRRSGVGRAL